MDALLGLILLIVAFQVIELVETLSAHFRKAEAEHCAGCDGTDDPTSHHFRRGA